MLAKSNDPNNGFIKKIDQSDLSWHIRVLNSATECVQWRTIHLVLKLLLSNKYEVFTDNWKAKCDYRAGGRSDLNWACYVQKPNSYKENYAIITPRIIDVHCDRCFKNFFRATLQEDGSTSFEVDHEIFNNKWNDFRYVVRLRNQGKTEEKISSHIIPKLRIKKLEERLSDLLSETFDRKAS